MVVRDLELKLLAARLCARLYNGNVVCQQPCSLACHKVVTAVLLVNNLVHLLVTRL